MIRCCQILCRGLGHHGIFKYRSLNKAPVFGVFFKPNVVVKRTSATNLRSLRLAPNSAGSYILLLIPATTFFLGTWQVKRRKWKLNLIDSLNERLQQSPMELPMDFEELHNMEYRRVVLRGTFDHSKEIYIAPRTLNKTDATPRGLLSSSSHNGAQVVTPFKLADRDETILVNRGWVPKNKVRPETRPEGQVQREVEVVAIYRKQEKRAPFMPKNDEKGSIWHWCETEAMAKKLDVSPYMFDATAVSSIDGGPIGGQTLITLRNEHFSYIITWYSLSILTTYLWYRRFVRGIPLM